MTSAESAAEAAVIAALEAGVTLAAVFQDPPEDTPLPVVVLGDIEAETFGGKGDRDRAIGLVVLSEVAGEARQPLLDIMAEIEAALDGARLSFDGWIVRPFFDTSTAALAPDGATYVGNTRFNVFALRDD